MGQCMADREYQRLLPIAQFAHANPHSLAHPAVAPIRANHQLGRDPAAIAQGDACLACACQKLGGSDAGAKIDIGQCRQMRHHFAAQQPIGQVPAKGQIRDISSIEIMGDTRLGLWSACIDDAHDLKRGRMGAKPCPKPNPVQKIARGL